MKVDAPLPNAIEDVLNGTRPFAVLDGDVFDLLPTIRPGSVACCVCSPPYWKLRSYLAKGHHLKHLELGSEPTPDEYIANLVRVFHLVRVAMHETAVAFINIGDSYSSGGGADPGNGNKGNTTNRGSRSRHDIAAGNLCLIPQRLALALQADGWIVRSIIAWTKLAPMPQSLSGWAWRKCRVKVNGQAVHTSGTSHGSAGVDGNGRQDRVDERLLAQWADCPGCKKCEKTSGYVLRRGSWRPTSSWEPILMLAKTSKYFCDSEAVKLPSTGQGGAAAEFFRKTGSRSGRCVDRVPSGNEAAYTGREDSGSANPRDVWRQKLEDMTREELIELVQSMGDGEATDVQSWSAEPLRHAHYAAFPAALPSFFLRAAVSQRGYCGKCGEPWVRVIEASAETEAVRSAPRGTDGYQSGGLERGSRFGSETPGFTPANETLGWRASCSCNAEPVSGVVLDPFVGSGRTGIAARRLGLRFIGCELNPSYAVLARRLISEDLPIFNTPASDGEAEACEAGSAGSLFDTLPADSPEGAGEEVKGTP